METTLEPDQYVLVDKLTPRFDAYKRGDIVVFNPPETWVRRHGMPYIKRVIGVGGDKVEIQRRQVFVNGIELDEPYVFKEDDGSPRRRTPAPDGATVGRARRASCSSWATTARSSADSREFGPVDVDDGHRPGLAPLLADQHADDPADPDPPGAREPAACAPAPVNLALAGFAGVAIGGGGPRGRPPASPGDAARPPRRPPRRAAHRRPVAGSPADPRRGSPPRSLPRRLLASRSAAWTTDTGSRIGWPAEALAAAAAAVIGLRQPWSRGAGLGTARGAGGRVRRSVSWPPRRSCPAATSSGSGRRDPAAPRRRSSSDRP